MVGEIGRDGDPYSLKMSSPVRICIMPREEVGRRRQTWLKTGDEDIGIRETIAGMCVNDLSCQLVLGAGNKGTGSKLELEMSGEGPERGGRRKGSESKFEASQLDINIRGREPHIERGCQCYLRESSVVRPEAVRK